MVGRGPRPRPRPGGGGVLDIGLGGFLGGVGVVAGIGVARVRLGGVFGVALGLADAVVLVACFAVGNR